MIDYHTLLIVLVMALVTALLRFFPFIVFNDKVKTPKLIVKLSKTLPFAVMGMLVVFCLKDISFTHFSGFLPPLISCVVVGIVHLWKRNTLVSIVLGVVCNMALVQFVF